MQLTITTLDDRIVNVDVSDDLEIENLMAQCEFELSIPSTNIVFVSNGVTLADGKKTLKQYGVKHGDVLLLREKNSQTGEGFSGGGFPRIDFGSIQIPGGSGAVHRPQTTQDLEDPRVMRRLIMDNPRERALLKERNPPLSDALESESEERFVDIYTRQRNERLAKDREQLRLLQMNPMDPEAQRLIAEEIRLKNVESNMESAIEHVPESFGQVIMLYIDCVVNGHHIKAFVDSGAQMTIMSQSCAERCNIMRLVDKRWAGIAKGVGTQKIIGRVHLEQIQIGKEFFPSSFSILENQPMDMLLGLDMLKRHQCVIDLKHNELVIGTTETRTKFLPENELPAHARGNAPPSADTSLTEMADRELAEALQKSAEEGTGGQSTSTSSKSDTLGTKNSSAGGKPANSSNILSPSVSSSNNTAQGASNSPAGASSAQRMFPEDMVRRMVEKGYTRHQVLEALTEANGDEQKAAVILFGKNVKLFL